MSRSLDLTQRQIRAICTGAKKAGYAPVIQVGKILIRLIPEDHALELSDDPDIDAGKDIRL